MPQHDPQGPEALLAAMGLLGEPDDVFPIEKFRLDHLADEVGGYDVLDSLDDAPLPDEEFAWGSVPEDARDQVQKVLDGCDRCAGDVSLAGSYYFQGRGERQGLSEPPRPRS